ncbi:hypothetical protein [Arthrobacter sp. H14]|uniref:hypothetical protein n=1 Tax=Arthrobacter sp. H14 TaxID=1312959 RepID=UPI00047BACF6|nr:hypothetical protein [Arthrobacter sp. H14]
MTNNTILLWTMIGTCLTAVATVGLVIGAFTAWHTARKTLDQMKSDSLAQTRPYIFASLVPSLSGPAKFDLVIENTGVSTARNVQFTCPEFPSKPDDVAEKLARFLNAKHTVPPKARLRNYWRLGLESGHEWSDGTTKPAGMPEQATLVIDYEDDAGREYQDIYALDVVGLLFAPVPAKGPNVKESLSDEQKDTHKMLGVLAAAIGELRR